MSKVKVIIIAGGEGSRWKNHTGVPKHLLKIDDETLLDRMVRQCVERGVKDIVIVGPSNDPRYIKRDCRTKEIDLLPLSAPKGERKAALCFSSMDEWSRDFKTCCLLGDVWYENDIMDRILNDEYHTFVMYGRNGPSRLTGKIWAEDFAITFYPADHALYRESMKTFDVKVTEPWRHVTKCFQDGDDKKHMVYAGGMTEDFDFPEDLDRWLYYRNKHRDDLSRCEIKVV